MIFSGARIDATTAERWGLVNEVVPGDELMRRARELALAITANAPVSVQLAKAAIDGDAASLEALAGALAASTDDGREGIASFREKRSPRFRGR
jgi:enoyl-CoA hydratase/carnithine racemase